MYSFQWETSAACASTTTPTRPPVEPTQDCFVVDSQAKARYDLTALSRSKGNWGVMDGEYEYLLNVCASVNGIAACADHSACQTKPSDSGFAYPLGLSSARPVVEEGILKLKLSGGKPCHDATYQRHTTIVFTCREDGGLGIPTFLEETDDCMYIFAWETSAACPEYVASECAAQDPDTKKYVDLTSLNRKEGQQNFVASTHVPGDTSQYKVNLCTGLVPNDNPCHPGTSICQIQSGQTVGRSLGNIGMLLGIFLSFPSSPPPTIP